MKKIILIIPLLIYQTMGCCSSVPVSAAITNSCTISNVGVMDFGNKSPGYVQNWSPFSSSFNVICTLQDTSINFNFDMGLNSDGANRQMKSTTANSFIKYQICPEDSCSEPTNSISVNAGTTILNVPVYAVTLKSAYMKLVGYIYKDLVTKNAKY